MEDLPESPNSSFSQFPANTNILFADLHAIEKFAEKSPLPGMLINMKNSISVPDDTGALQEVKGGRVESTMQNISDFIKEYHSHTLQEEEMLRLKTFVTYNDRKKTISVTKHSYNPGQSIAETPEGAFFDLLQNNRELLTKDCSIQVPEMASVEDYLRNGPSFIFHYHPALGPLYSIIGQKLRGGRLAKNAELQLEIADADIQDLDLDGSMLIQADSPLGRADGSGFIQYGSGIGKCLLKNVRVKNKGINREENNVYWKNQIARHEWLRIVIQGSGEFIAEDVAFQGNYLIEVPDNTRVRAYQTDEGVSFEKTEIRTPSWSWNYSFDENNNMELKKKQQTP
jgi:hypothetical protein